MPQGRRKVPFSGKAKKEQLKVKKQGKNQQVSGKRAIIVKNSDDDDEEKQQIRRINEQPHKSNRSGSNRYALKFYADSPEEIKHNKELSRHEIIPVEEKDLEIFSDKYFPADISFPKRPEWSYEMSTQELEAREHRYFTEYLKELENKDDWKKMSYFELNLETWRQLWRVLEISDIVLFIVDIRYAGLMFPPALYKYVAKTLNKDMILVLNKVDLAPASLVLAWKRYFNHTFPKLHVVMFTTLPGYNLRGNQSEKSGLKIRRRKGRIRMAAEGAQLLQETCQKIVGSEVDLTPWKQKIQEEISSEYDDDDNSLDIGEVVTVNKVDTGFVEHEKYQNGVLTVGCLGQPNVGKSSLMNALMGKKVVSVSKTPGHTKHFQTIFLTQNVRLCDCPGLVFPSQVPKPVQVLMGSFPIAQLRDPYTTVRFLAERLHLIELLKLQHPTGDDSWSSIDICDGWAKKRGFLTAKAARLDTYKAANNILRMALDGKICLCLYPPYYTTKKGEFLSDPELKTVQWIQALSEDAEKGASSSRFNLSDLSEDEEDINKKTADIKSDENSEEEEEDDSDSDEPVTSQVNKFSMLDVE